MAKGKAAAPAAATPAGGRDRGGAGRGQGRKAVGASGSSNSNVWSTEALAELLGGGSDSISDGDRPDSSSEVPLPAATRCDHEADDRADVGADVDNNTAGGLSSWLGRDAAERRGLHAGTDLGVTRV